MWLSMKWIKSGDRWAWWKIPNRTGTIDVGSAGTAARFLTAMLALSDGGYTINATPQMQARPMDSLLKH